MVVRDEPTVIRGGAERRSRVRVITCGDWYTAGRQATRIGQIGALGRPHVVTPDDGDPDSETGDRRYATADHELWSPRCVVVPKDTAASGR